MSSLRLPSAFPNFIVIGASKSGTSSLYAYLKQHPEIYLSHIKETQYFNYNEIYSLGPHRFVDTYYAGVDSHKAVGDITPSYLGQSDTVIPRLLATYGDCQPKFILIMRNPVERAWSHYQHMVRSGQEAESLDRALDLESARLRDCPQGWWGYVSEGMYAMHLKKWLDAYLIENFLFLRTEDLASDPQAVLQSIYKFLCVDTNYVVKDLERKSGSVRSDRVLSMLGSPSLAKDMVKKLLPLRYRQKLKTRIIEMNSDKHSANIGVPDDLRKALSLRFAPEVRELEAITRMDFSSWKL